MAHMTPQNDHETVQIKPKSHVNFFFLYSGDPTHCVGGKCRSSSFFKILVLVFSVKLYSL